MGTLLCRLDGPGLEKVRTTPELDPLTLAHQRLDLILGGDAVHVHSAGADHPVDVDQAVVRAELRELFRGELVSILEATAVGLAERNVRRGVFVEERVVKKQTAACDWRRVRYERHL